MTRHVLTSILFIIVISALPTQTLSSLFSPLPPLPARPLPIPSNVLFTQSPTSLPGYASKMCTSVMKFKYTNTQFYTSVAYIFSEDGLTYDVVATHRHNQPLDSKQLYNWTMFPLVIFKNYAINGTNNPNFIYGIAQHSYLYSSKSWLAHLGYQQTVIHFFSNFTRAHTQTGADWYMSENMRHAIQSFYPPNFFGSYKGNAWYKEPYTFASNGFADKDANPNPYFKCVPYNRGPNATIVITPTQFLLTDRQVNCMLQLLPMNC